MDFYFYTNIAFEDWDYDNSVKEGIGGSETSIVEMSWRLARRGHNVTVYAPIKKTTNPNWRGTKWERFENADFKKKGIWILYRCPDMIDKFIPKRQGQTLWFMMQDWDYPTWTDKRIKRMDKVITLCKAHGNYTLKNHPKIGKRMWISSNGIKIDLIEEIEKEMQKKVKRFAFDVGGTLETHEELRQLARDVYAAGHEVHIVPALGRGYPVAYEWWMQNINVPYTAIHRAEHDYNATPQQVADTKLEILKEIKADYFWDDLPHNVNTAKTIGVKAFRVFENTPAKLVKYEIVRNPFRIMHASSPDRGLKQALLSFRKARQYVPKLEFHAFYGFNNLEKLAKENKRFKKIITEIKQLLKQPGVKFHGRVSQNELYQQWFKSGIYIYETNFFETSNIASQEAQAMGAVPVFSPIYAQKENIRHGIGVEGDSNDPLTHARFAAELVKLTENPHLQGAVRKEMMGWARERFDWEVFVTQWEDEAMGSRAFFEASYPFPQQL